MRAPVDTDRFSVNAGFVHRSTVPHPPGVRALKERKGISGILVTTGYSLAGLRAVWRTEVAFRQLVLINAVLLPLAFYLDVSRAERALLILAPFLALIVELLNSAIEAAIDRISLELHPLSKCAKDMGSAAQFLALALICLVWSVILLP